eukprot:13428588-Ditylum_brightwellii.AAC.1
MWIGLEWEVIEINTSADFMDLTMSIKNGKIQTKLFEKSLNLYLYIPPHLAHPPGRGYQRTDVLLIFNKAIHHDSPTMISQRALNQELILRDSEKKHVYLHMRYQPDNAPSYKFQ